MCSCWSCSPSTWHKLAAKPQWNPTFNYRLFLLLTAATGKTDFRLSCSSHSLTWQHGSRRDLLDMLTSNLWLKIVILRLRFTEPPRLTDSREEASSCLHCIIFIIALPLSLHPEATHAATELKNYILKFYGRSRHELLMVDGSSDTAAAGRSGRSSYTIINDMFSNGV